jgi:hypothetical protein
MGRNPSDKIIDLIMTNLLNSSMMYGDVGGNNN